MFGSFETFVRDRARLLALELCALVEAPSELRVELTGQPDLIDAFEMACTLGPRRCIVHTVERTPGPGSNSDRAGDETA